jgi:BirA family biotin operon repressor/biotin-[acetyl-CoA-carboxylase] ligase
VVVAESQTSGRGRLRREWFSPPGLGIYLSVLLRPVLPAKESTRWTIASALAACEACRETSGVPVVIKWPNDLCHEGRKLGGTLVELRSAGAVTREIIIGTGINVNHSMNDFPPPLADRATSLRVAGGGAQVDRADLTAGYLARLARRADQLDRGRWEEIREAWKGLAPGATGARVQVRPSSSTDRGEGYTGTTCGIDEAGALRVETGEGRFVTVHDGERVVALES